MKKQQPNIYEAVYWWILGTLRPIRSNALVPMYCKFQSVGGTSFTSDLIIVHKKKHASFSWHHPTFIIPEFISSFKLKQEEKNSYIYADYSSTLRILYQFCFHLLWRKKYWFVWSSYILINSTRWVFENEAFAHEWVKVIKLQVTF